MGYSTAGILAQYWHWHYKDDFIKLLADLPVHISVKRSHLATWSRMHHYYFTYEEVKLALGSSNVGDSHYARSNDSFIT